jgi:hypothetical protein
VYTAALGVDPEEGSNNPNEQAANPQEEVVSKTIGQNGTKYEGLYSVPCIEPFIEGALGGEG